MPRIAKGSDAAKEWGQRMKALRKPRAAAAASGPVKEEIKIDTAKDAAAPEEIKIKTKLVIPGAPMKRPSKGSVEAREFMAKLRAMKK